MFNYWITCAAGANANLQNVSHLGFNELRTQHRKNCTSNWIAQYISNDEIFSLSLVRNFQLLCFFLFLISSSSSCCLGERENSKLVGSVEHYPTSITDRFWLVFSLALCCALCRVTIAVRFFIVCENVNLSTSNFRLSSTQLNTSFPPHTIARSACSLSPQKSSVLSNHFFFCLILSHVARRVWV